jgi:hypothetical protein
MVKMQKIIGCNILETFEGEELNIGFSNMKHHI